MSEGFWRRGGPCVHMRKREPWSQIGTIRWKVTRALPSVWMSSLTWALSATTVSLRWFFLSTPSKKHSPFNLKPSFQMAFPPAGMRGPARCSLLHARPPCRPHASLFFLFPIGGLTLASSPSSGTLMAQPMAILTSSWVCRARTGCILAGTKQINSFLLFLHSSLFFCLANSIINSLSVGSGYIPLHLIELLAWCLGLDKRCIIITGRVVENSAGFSSGGLPGLSLHHRYLNIEPLHFPSFFFFF